MGRRAAAVAAAIIAGLAVLGCMGGNIFGANPGDGGCGFRPDGLIVDDITGVWEGDGRTFTLKLDGTITGKALLYSPAPSASASRTLPRNPTEVDATGHWALKPNTDSGDIDISDVRSARGEATFGLGSLYVSGSRRQPFFYTFGDGDPDSCDIVKYERTSRG
jgi:hypothetical protein